MAFYEDAARTEVAARAEGFTGDGSLMDYVEPHNYCTAKVFPTLAAAEEWLKGEIAARKTVFGAGTIRARETVERRCRYCVCSGVRTLHEYIVDDTGIIEDAEIDSDCCD